MIATLPILTQGDNWFTVFDDIGRKYPNIAGDVFLLFMQADGARDIPSCIYDAGMRYKARLMGRRTKAEFVSFDDERDVDVYDDSHADILEALTVEDNRALSILEWIKAEFADNPKYLKIAIALAQGSTVEESGHNVGVSQQMASKYLSVIRERMPYRLTVKR